MINRSHARGFTLIELLVSLVVFAYLMLAAFKLFNSILDTNERSRTQFEAQNRNALAWSIIFQDLFQIRTRPHRDIGGDKQAAMESTQEYLIRFIRAGLPPINGVTPGGMQRVAYKLEENTLYRLTWPALDLASDSEPAQQVLITDLDDARIEFLDDENKYVADWPPASNVKSYTNMPRMLKIDIRYEDGREMMRLFPSIGQ